MKLSRSLHKRQSGVILPIVALSITVLVGMAGLALDLAHAFQEKALAQNALDAGALAGAKRLNSGYSLADSTTQAQAVFKRQFSAGSAFYNATPTVLFSVTLAGPYTAAPVGAKFIQVALPPGQVSMTVYLASALPGGINALSITGGAVAGPQALNTGPGAQVCDLAPVVMCALNADTDCSDGACYGYGAIGSPIGSEVTTCLKGTAGGCPGFLTPGNMAFLDLGCSGATCVKKGLAGGNGSIACAGINSLLNSETGNVGSASQGFNSRFGEGQSTYNDQAVYPPDVVTQNPNMYSAAYQAAVQAGSYDYQPIPGGTGVEGRRYVPAPIADSTSPFCSGGTGKTTGTMVAIACMFATTLMGNGSTPDLHVQLVGVKNSNGIYGDISRCKLQGTPSPTPVPVSGNAYRIVIYKNPGSGDS